MEKIILTELEEKMLDLNVRREFFPHTATPEEAAAMNSVIDKASKLMDDLDAYDLIGESLMEWFQNIYKAQQEDGKPAEGE